MTTPAEAALQQQLDEALARVGEAERAMIQSQKRLDDALARGADTTLSRRLRRETESLMFAAKGQVDEAKAAFGAYRQELDRTAAARMMRATHASIEALLARFDTSKWESNPNAN